MDKFAQRNQSRVMKCSGFQTKQRHRLTLTTPSVGQILWCPSCSEHTQTNDNAQSGSQSFVYLQEITPLSAFGQRQGEQYQWVPTVLILAWFFSCMGNEVHAWTGLKFIKCTTFQTNDLNSDDQAPLSLFLASLEAWLSLSLWSRLKYFNIFWMVFFLFRRFVQTFPRGWIWMTLVIPVKSHLVFPSLDTHWLPSDVNVSFDSDCQLLQPSFGASTLW